MGGEPQGGLFGFRSRQWRFVGSAKANGSPGETMNVAVMSLSSSDLSSHIGGAAWLKGWEE